MKGNETFAVVIPARFKSTRFPGKPLVEICGKPMIRHVWERCCLAVSKDDVYVATDDVRIKDVVLSFGGNVIMTSSDCLTGTDRLAEANIKLDRDFIVNVQGDEPLISPNDIIQVINAFKKTGNVTNAMCRINSVEEFNSINTPKVVFSNSMKLLYMSRAPIPRAKSAKVSFGYKQVCIYALSREQLSFFYGLGKKTPNEEIEDIEILRFLDSDYVVNMVEVESGSLAVDVLEDVQNVVNRLLQQN